MNWVNQKSGKINHYNKNTQVGTQPIRVLNHMFLNEFITTYPEFSSKLKQQISEGKIHRELDLKLGEVQLRIENETFRTPRVFGSTKQIEIHESFLSFLWCAIYSVYTIYIETIDYPKCNREVGIEKYKIRPEKILEAENLFNYGKSLIAFYSDWDKDELPNPEIYYAEDRNYVEQTNIFYYEALKFILFHEYTHLIKHIDKIDPYTANSFYFEYEKEADEKAIESIKKGSINAPYFVAMGQKLATEIGVVMGILSMFFFKASTTGKKHPNAEDRLTLALESLNPKGDSVWGIACVGLQLWDKQFNLNFNWQTENMSAKEQYYDIIKQIKAGL